MKEKSYKVRRVKIVLDMADGTTHEVEAEDATFPGLSVSNFQMLKEMRGHAEPAEHTGAFFLTFEMRSQVPFSNPHYEEANA